MPKRHDSLQQRMLAGIAMRPDLPVQDTRLYRVVADRIREIIRRESNQAGARLPSQREMSATLQVSRASVREALVELELRGEIEVRGGSGVYVAKPADASTRGAQSGPGPAEVLAARRMIEPEVAALAARVATDRAIDVIFDAAVAIEGAGRDFHLAIALAAGNCVLYGVLAQLLDPRGAGRDLATLTEHRTIAGAIARRDPAAARRAMRAHLDRLAKSND